jgi:RHS repeat-associated protein
MQRNGNETMRHNGQPAIGLKMDNLKYNYNTTTTGTGANAVTHLLNNKLRSVNDAVVGNNYTQDIKNHADIDNYTYDKIGNLTADIAGNLKSIEWTLYGKVKKVTKDNGNLITFAYDAAGNRIKKTTEIKGYVTTTYYTRDAQGNVLAVYTNDQDGNNEFYLSEVPLYGSSRLGEWRPRRLLDIVAAENTVTTLSGEKTYELSNHLGNVLAVVSDELSPFGGVGGGEAVVVSATDYYAFGQEMPGRTFASEDYRYGFNGKENDREWGESLIQDYGMRLYNPALCRFLSVDPLYQSYPWNSTYAFAEGDVIRCIDLDGGEKTDPVYMGEEALGYLTPKLKVDMSNAPANFKTVSGKVFTTTQNAYGANRNGPWYWNEVRKNHPEMFDDTNNWRLDRGKAPISNPTFRAENPQFTNFRNQVLDHHHLEHGNIAHGLPRELHTGKTFTKMWHKVGKATGTKIFLLGILLTLSDIASAQTSPTNATEIGAAMDLVAKNQLDETDRHLLSFAISKGYAEATQYMENCRSCGQEMGVYYATDDEVKKLVEKGTLGNVAGSSSFKRNAFYKNTSSAQKGTQKDATNAIIYTKDKGNTDSNYSPFAVMPVPE